MSNLHLYEIEPDAAVGKKTTKSSEYFLSDFTDILSHVFLRFMINIFKGDSSFILGSTIVDITLRKPDRAREIRAFAECNIFIYCN